MKLVLGAAALVLTAASASAQSAQPATAPPSPEAAAQGAGRSFTAPVGLLFNTVRPERVADFERVIGYVQDALQRSTDPTVREQARGWRMFKASEPGPGGTVLYVFLMDPAVRGADYGFGRLLAEAYPDTAQLQEIWKLYTGAVTGGGSLLNLTPVVPGAAPPPAASPSAVPAAPVERAIPPDADPTRR